jgi:hypothetical protein
VVLLSCNKLAKAVTMEISLPSVPCASGNIPLAVVGCGERGTGGKSRGDTGTFELIPAAEENVQSPLLPQARVGLSLDTEILRPQWVSAPADHKPAHRLPPAIDKATATGGPIAATICLAWLLLSAGRNAEPWPPKRRRHRHHKKTAQRHVGAARLEHG